MLSAYLYCGRKLFMERVLGMLEIPKAALVNGSVRHSVYDIINKKEEFIVKSFKSKLKLADIESRYRKNYAKVLREVIISKKHSIEAVSMDPLTLFKKNWVYFLHESKVRSINIFNFINENKVFGDELWVKLFPKIESELRAESKLLSLKGIIDQIEVWPDKYVPIELKTGRAPATGVWPGHRVQLGCYALLLEEKFGVKIEKGEVRYLDSFENREVVINSFMREEVVELVGKVKELLSGDVLPDFCGNENKCKACSLKPLCYDESYMSNKMSELSRKNKQKV
jgi:CRISPR-associated protein Cas4